MTCAAEINRYFRTRDGAFCYLAARGFRFVPHGWTNGRWAATVTDEHTLFHVSIWLRLSEAA